MAFKLGSKRGNTEMKLSIGGANHHMVGGVRVEFKELPESIKGECHKEGVIYISDDIQKNSEEYNRGVSS